MAKISLLKNNFTSGELSPHIWMRTDLQQFRNGAKEVVNMTPIGFCCTKLFLKASSAI